MQSPLLADQPDSSFHVALRPNQYSSVPQSFTFPSTITSVDAKSRRNQTIKALSAIVLIVAWFVIPGVLNATQSGPSYALSRCAEHSYIGGPSSCPDGTGTPELPCCSHFVWKYEEIRCTSSYCWQPVFGQTSLYLYFGFTTPFFAILITILYCRATREQRAHPASTYLPSSEIVLVPLQNVDATQSSRQ